jgi:hypothetical protein
MSFKWHRERYEVNFVRIESILTPWCETRIQCIIRQFAPQLILTFCDYLQVTKNISIRLVLHGALIWWLTMNALSISTQSIHGSVLKC